MVYNGDKCCNHCSHKEVCSLKADFEKAQKAVDDCSVSLGKEGHGYAVKYLRNFDFIKPVKLECKHFAASEITLRETHAADIH